MSTPEVKATSTKWQKGRFDTHLYLRVTPEGTLLPLVKAQRRAAHYKIKLTLEYPTYQEEIDITREATRYDRNEHIHYTDLPTLYESRVRRCLVQWDLHERIPALEVNKLHRHNRQLDDESLNMWQDLPPLLRKAIVEAVMRFVGGD
jgi:hypothetical protein